MSDSIANTLAHQQSGSRAEPVAVSLWFDMQTDADITQTVSSWALTLAQAHADQRVKVLAHPDSAYAHSRLLCDLVKQELWPTEQWHAVLAQTVAEARAQLGNQNNHINHPINQIVIILPYRASPVLWTQWLLQQSQNLGMYLDHSVGLIQSVPGWEHAFTRPDALRWLVLDRIITYSSYGSYGSEQMENLVTHLRAFNPLTHWIHDSVFGADILVEPLKAHDKTAPHTKTVFKTDDLDAWNADKVVYLPISYEVNFVRIGRLMQYWQHKYGSQIVRIWAQLRVSQNSEPWFVNGVRHLWMMDFSPLPTTDRVLEGGVWLLGKNLDAAALAIEMSQCKA